MDVHFILLSLRSASADTIVALAMLRSALSAINLVFSWFQLICTVAAKSNKKHNNEIISM